MNYWDDYAHLVWESPEFKNVSFRLDEDLIEQLKEQAREFVKEDKYSRNIKGAEVDVYDILHAFNVTNPALQHLIKKALMPGERGHKDIEKDMKEIISSAKRAAELEGIDGE